MLGRSIVAMMAYEFKSAMFKFKIFPPDEAHQRADHRPARLGGPPA